MLKLRSSEELIGAKIKSEGDAMRVSQIGEGDEGVVDAKILNPDSKPAGHPF